MSAAYTIFFRELIAAIVNVHLWPSTGFLIALPILFCSVSMVHVYAHSGWEWVLSSHRLMIIFSCVLIKNKNWSSFPCWNFAWICRFWIFYKFITSNLCSLFQKFQIRSLIPSIYQKNKHSFSVTLSQDWIKRQKVEINWWWSLISIEKKIK